MDVQLPQEVLQQIFSYLSGNQKALHACSLTSLSWYSASIAYLYEDPIITGKNYDPFVRAICPSVNAHVRRNGLAELVTRLDMSSLVHNGSRSLTARLLGRVKMKLEEFVAPQASFAYVLHLLRGVEVVQVRGTCPIARSLIPLLTLWRVNCLAALSKCSNLRHLDLSFVSESISMTDLLRSTSLLSKLESLHLRTYFCGPKSSLEPCSRPLTNLPRSVYPAHTFQGSNLFWNVQADSEIINSSIIRT